MQGDKTRAQRGALINRMAETVGVDLDEVELRGALAPEQREEMLLARTGCADPTGCALAGPHPKRRCRA